MEGPELFVARDRARRFARRLRDTATERRLAYRGADVGMASLVNEAEATLTPLLEDIRTTIADIEAGRIRDRERGYMEVPLVVASAAVAERVELAQRLDRALSRSGVPAREGRTAVLELLDAALARLDAYSGSYDAKEPVGPPVAHDLGHRLATIEADATWRRRLAGATVADGPATDRRAPHVLAPPHALDDLLRAVRRTVPLVPGPWHVSTDEDEGLVTLALGAGPEGLEALALPGDIENAKGVLGFRVATDVQLYGRAAPRTGGLLTPAAAGDDVRGVRVVLPLPTATPGGADLEAAAGPDAQLSPAARTALEALGRAPAPGPDGTPPPARLVAWMGLFAALDQELKRVVLARARSNSVRVISGRLPRESTRKAPLKAAVLDTLGRAFDGLAVDRADAIADELAAGKPATSRAQVADAAIVLALVGRTWDVAGVHLPRALVMDPLDDREVQALVHDLLTVARARRALESGAGLDRANVREMERALVGALGRLGRVVP
ncbi:MAG: hypothetical protein AB7T63_01135 [Planctomycetota bacterium]